MSIHTMYFRNLSSPAKSLMASRRTTMPGLLFQNYPQWQTPGIFRLCLISAGMAVSSRSQAERNLALVPAYKARYDASTVQVKHPACNLDSLAAVLIDTAFVRECTLTQEVRKVHLCKVAIDTKKFRTVLCLTTGALGHSPVTLCVEHIAWLTTVRRKT